MRTRRDTMTIKVLKKTYQRNGIGGEGFFVILAEVDGEVLVITTEGTNTNRCRAINPFNLEASYRGDRIGEALVQYGIVTKDE